MYDLLVGEMGALNSEHRALTRVLEKTEDEMKDRRRIAQGARSITMRESALTRSRYCTSTRGTGNKVLAATNQRSSRPESR